MPQIKIAETYYETPQPVIDKLQELNSEIERMNEIFFEQKLYIETLNKENIALIKTTEIVKKFKDALPHKYATPSERARAWRIRKEIFESLRK